MVTEEPREVIEIYPVFADRETNHATAAGSHAAPAGSVRRTDDENRVEPVADDEHRAGLGGERTLGACSTNSSVGSIAEEIAAITGR
jgi:hypothetical protein